MNVINFFSGIEVGRLIAEELGWNIENWYSSEIDPYAIKVANNNHKDLINVGDITEWKDWEWIYDLDWSKIDLILAGSPCQGFSFAGKQLNFDDSRSALFLVFKDILNYVKSVNPNIKFMLENVVMKQEYSNVISEYLALRPIRINSALTSAHNRVRNYWTNIEGIEQPRDRKIFLSDIFERNLPSCGIGGRIVGRRLNELGKREDYNKNIPISQYLEIRKDNKANCMTTVYKDSIVPYFKTDKRLKIKFKQNKASCLTGGGNSGGNHSDMDILIIEPDVCRKYSVIECERLMSLPDEYTQGVSNSQRYKMLGNTWEKEAVKHVLSYYKVCNKKKKRKLSRMIL